MSKICNKELLHVISSFLRTKLKTLYVHKRSFSVVPVY